MIGISVIICCYNSSTRIKSTLDHIVGQNNIDLNCWEVILIDNSSTDDTAKIAESIWSNYKLDKPNFRIVYEKNPGLSNARRKGIELSNFEYLVFCDDDNWLGSNYLSLALSIISSNGKIGVLGGNGIPFFESCEPPFFWKNQFHALAVGPQDKYLGDITHSRGVVYGAGMVINKSAYYDLIKNYDFSFQVSDRVGNLLLSSGDHELCLALRRIGYKIYWNDKLCFNHYIPSVRTSIKYYKKLFAGFGMSHAMLIGYRVGIHNNNSIKDHYIYLILRYLKNILKTFIKILIRGYFLSDNKYAYIDDLHFLYSNIGSFKSTLKHKNTYLNKFKSTKLYYTKI